MRWGLRACGWLLLGLAMIAVAVLVVVGALRAHGAAEFNRWVGWATVAAVPVAALGVLLVVWDKVTASRTPGAWLGSEGIREELAAVVLAQAQVARSQLIGAGEVGDQAANVRFVKGTGRFREVGGARSGDLDTILDYYQSLSPARLVILGGPGAGKTVLATELQVQLLEHPAVGHPEATVPVLISAAAYDTRQPWAEWLAGHLALRFALTATMTARLIRDGVILPIVDGLDEMDPAGNPDRAVALISALNAAMRGRDRAPAVLTCRHADYQALPRQLDRATHVEILPLTGKEAVAYLREQFLTQDEQGRWQPVLNALHHHPDKALAGQLTTPWRLTLALTAYRDAGDPAQLLPLGPVLVDAAARRYAQRVDSLLLGQYLDAAVRLHGPGGRYTSRQLHHWLTALAQGLDWQARHHGSATDIQLHQWWQPVGKRSAQIIHLVLACLPALAWFAAAAITGDLAQALGGAALSAAGATGWLSFSPSRLKLRQLTGRASLKSTALGLLTGLAAGVASGVVTGLTLGLATGLATGLGAGGGAFVVTWLQEGARDNAPQATGPREVIRADGRYGLIVGLAFVFFFILSIGLSQGFAPGFSLAFASAFGFSAGLAAGLAFAANVWTRYHITVVIIAARRRGPVRFAAFLDWAHRAGLLRASGIAYQFRQQQLQDWLTSPRQPTDDQEPHLSAT